MAKPPEKSIVIVSRKLAKLPWRADFSLFASRAGWQVFEGCWDSDGSAPQVIGFEARETVVVIVGDVPNVEGVGLDRLFLRQGFPVVLVGGEGGGALPNVDPVAWIYGATSFSSGKAPLPEGSARRARSPEPEDIFRAVAPCP